MELTALGMTDGVGSMLVGAQDQGFDIVGNIEWRKYYHTGTWQYNFNNAWMVHSWEESKGKIPSKLTMVMGHPECGQYSALGYSSLGNDPDRFTVPSDIPIFIHGIQQTKPEFFAMDNLLKSLHAVPLTEWSKELPDYDIYSEYISNYHYGNVQLCRKRMFIIGAKKKYGYVFKPGEEEHDVSVWDTIGGLYGKDEYEYENHVQFPDDLITPNREYFSAKALTVAESAEVFKTLKPGRAPSYINKEGLEKNRIGMMKLYKDKHCHTITGTNYHMHPVSCKPLTCRERARIQGFPDTFKFLFKRKKDHYTTNMSRQTGKAMPLQFCTFLSDQFKHHYLGKDQPNPSGKRHLRDPLIEDVKVEYCKNVGYSNQSEACRWCSIQECPIRKEAPLAMYSAPTRNMGGGGYRAR